MRLSRFGFAVVSVALFHGMVSFTSAADSAPKTLQEGLQRLEGVFGKHNPDKTRLFRIETKTDRTNPAADDPSLSVHLLADTVQIFGNPVLVSQNIVVDLNRLTDFKSTTSSEKGEVVKTVDSQSYSVEQFTFTLASSGHWLYTVRNRAHSLPQYSDSHSENGQVVWLEDGIRLEGVSGFVNFIESQKPILAIQHRKWNYKRSEDTLAVSCETQTYSPVKSDSGLEIPVPDFTKPVGAKIQFEHKSLPLAR